MCIKPNFAGGWIDWQHYKYYSIMHKTPKGSLCVSKDVSAWVLPDSEKGYCHLHILGTSDDALPLWIMMERGGKWRVFSTRGSLKCKNSTDTAITINVCVRLCVSVCVAESMWVQWGIIIWVCACLHERRRDTKDCWGWSSIKESNT